jgi:hypothetical protein
MTDGLVEELPDPGEHLRSRVAVVELVVEPVEG